MARIDVEQINESHLRWPTPIAKTPEAVQALQRVEAAVEAGDGTFNWTIVDNKNGNPGLVDLVIDIKL